MGFFAVRPEIQQRLAILVPLVALALSLFVVYPAWGNYNDLKAQMAHQRTELSDLKKMAIATPGPVAPTAVDVPSEPPAFLGAIRILAHETNCRLVGFDLAPEGKAADSGPVRAVRAKLDLEANYVQIRDFLYRLNHVGRLLVVTDLEVTTTANTGNRNAPSYGPLHATLDIERYVTPPAAKT